MFNISYVRTEFHGDPEEHNAKLSVFLYDVPYLCSFYIFPPLHILNQYLVIGTAGGGMSPGCEWEPFVLDEEQYRQLLPLVLCPDLVKLRKCARYAMFAYEIDPEFDDIQDRFEWAKAISQKHRESYFIRQKNYLDDLQSD